MENLGYAKPLYFLAFDHRASFSKDILGLSSEPSGEDLEKVKDMKIMLFEALKKGIEMGVPKENAALLTDEQFGGEVLKKAKHEGLVFAVCTEKSGQAEFAFEHGDEFGQKLLEIKPTFAKALVRYNPEDPDKEKNKRQLATLKKLSDFCHEHRIKLLVEPLILPTEEELKAYNGDKKRYDLEMRPKLMVKMVKEFQDGGVETDVWKIEGLEKREEYAAVVSQAQEGGRVGVMAVILGRGADNAQVDKWLMAAKTVPGMKGFAIGRSIFHDALLAYKEGRMTREDAVLDIAQNYFHFYEVYTKS